MLPDAFGGSPLQVTSTPSPSPAPAVASPPPLQRTSMSAIRAKFPMYSDMSDDQLLIGLHKKYYSDVPATQFFGSVDRDTERQRLNAQNTTEDMNPLERGLGAAKTALDRAAFGVKSMLPQSVQNAGDAVDRAFGSGGLQQSDVQQGQDFTKKAGTAGTVGDIAANTLLMLPAGGAATGALKVGTSVLPRAVGALARGVGELGAGAGMGAVTAMPGERQQGALAGAAGSALGLGVNRLVGGAVKPLVTPEAQALMDQGIQPTVGQSVGGVGNQLEEKLASSLPFIRGARNRAVDEFNTAAIQKAAPGVTGVGDAALSGARDAINAQYDHALSLMPQQFTVESHPIVQAAVTAVDDPALALSKDAQARVLDYVQNNLLNRTANITPDIAKRVESDMGAAVARLRSSSTAEERAMGDALGTVQQQWHDSLTAVGNSTNTGAGDALRSADAQWRAFRAVDRAGASAGAQGAETAGTFTPRQLRRSIEAEDKSQFNRSTRYGTVDPTSPFGQLNSLTSDAGAVLPNRVPDSGTAGRMLPMALAATLSGAHGGLPGLAAAGAGSAALGLGSTRVGQQFLTQGLSPAVDALVSRGYLPEQATRLVQQVGPDIAMAMARGAAPQLKQQVTGAPYAPQ